MKVDFKKEIRFQKNAFGWWILVIQDDKTKEKIEKILNLEGDLHQCSDCGQIHILKEKWWESK